MQNAIDRTKNYTDISLSAWIQGYDIEASQNRPDQLIVSWKIKGTTGWTELDKIPLGDHIEWWHYTGLLGSSADKEEIVIRFSLLNKNNTNENPLNYALIDNVRLTGTPVPASVPLPAPFLLLGSGLVGLVGLGRRFKK